VTAKPGPPTLSAPSIIDDLLWRGLLQDSTDLDELRRHFAAGPVTFYVGFDPTAPSLQVGNLVQVLTARRLQRAGNRPLLLVGGATGLIGDPKAEGERVLNDESVVAGWVDKIRRQVAPFFEFEGDHAAQMVNNLDWTQPLSAIEFLRDIGKHFPVNQMINREIVRARLEAGISFTELSYQILQGHDYFQLNQRYGCTLQHGGSDQWGNILSGVDFCRRKGVRGVHAFVTPLVTRADGTKFGKSAAGMSLWLDASMTSPYAFYQFWINTDDADIVKYLKVFSFASREEIEALATQTEAQPAARAAQRHLAEELTTLLHGADECAQVVAASQALFGRGSLAELAPATLHAALTEAGLVTVKGELPPVAVLLKEAGLVASMNEARRTITEGGAYVNNERVTSVDATIAPQTLLHGRFAVLRRGRRSVAGVEHTS
jgi:tyrosyl-tRNA synthetase